MRGAGKLSEARQLARKALQIDSNAAEHWKVAGRVTLDVAYEKIFTGYAATKNAESLREAVPFLREARTAYEQCLQRAPDNREALRELAQVVAWEVMLTLPEQSTSDWEANLQNLQQRVLQFLQHSPHGIEAAMMTLIVIYGINAVAGDCISPEAAEPLRKGLEGLQRAVEARVEAIAKNAGEQTNALLKITRALLKITNQGEMDQETMHEIFQSLASRERDNPRWQLGLIALDASQANWEAVERTARESLQRRPVPEIHHWLIVALDRQGKLDEANRAIDEFYRAFPEDP